MKLGRKKGCSVKLLMLLALISTVWSGRLVLASSQGGGAGAADPSKKIVTTTSGLKYIDEKVGSGAAAMKGQRVRVHYTGWLQNGQN